jgi:hypothetical protein
MANKRFGWTPLGLFLGLVLSIFAIAPARATDGGAVADPPVASAAAIAALRDRGPDGLHEALAIYDRINRRIEEASHHSNSQVVTKAPASPTSATDPVSLESQMRIARLNDSLGQWRAAIDQIGGQRSCTVSRLYWHTDFAKAQAEAERTGRPILSLRMLGKLTDEFSCANSRFFRTSLYSNQEISQYLRDHFVLHWQSVRPVPRVTIDFGDGRKLERTLTGNSAHIVLDAHGKPLDVLPGLYSPQRFQAWLQSVKTLYDDTYQKTPRDARPQALMNYHVAMREWLLQNWNRDIGRLGETGAAAVVARIEGAIAVAKASGQKVPDTNTNDAVPDALKAARFAFTKSVVEMPMFRLANLGGIWLEKGMDDDLWQAVANLHRGEVKLDNASVALMRAEFPNAVEAGRIAMGKGKIEDPIVRMVAQFENSIALDTVRNEYLLHRRIHERFANGDEVTKSVDALNEWVYAELFLTPSSDPWLGLAPPDVYTALDNNGRVAASTSTAGRE